MDQHVMYLSIIWQHVLLVYWMMILTLVQMQVYQELYFEENFVDVLTTNGTNNALLTDIS